MKKLLSTVSFLLASLMIYAQTLTVSGVVSDVNGVGVPNVQVNINHPAIGTNLGLSTVITDSLGFYSWSDTTGTTLQTAAFSVTLVNCNGTYLPMALSIIPNVTNYTANFTYCSSNPSGGNNCIASYIFHTDPANTLKQYFFAQPFSGTAPYTYSWDFGDGNTSSLANPVHTFLQTGYYTICLNITDATGCTSQNFCQMLFVYASSNCSVSYTATNSTTNLLTYNFNATAPAGNFLYSWNFGDGTFITTTTPTTTYTYPAGGVYHSCLSIYDTITGCYDYQCNVVFAGSTGNCGVYFSHHALSNYLLQSFQAYSYYNVAGSSYLWDFGDGTTSTQSNPTHLYSQAGIYNVCLTFTDVNNCTSSFCYDIYVFNTNCSLNYSFSNTTAAPLTYNFSSSFVSPNAIYIWNYGDGSSDTTSSPTTTYTYTTTGTYHSCLTIYDVASGCLSNVCQAIYAGSVNGNCGNYLYAYNDTLSYLTYNFIGVSYSGNTASTYLWDFGDGNTSTAATPTHTYTQAGEYTVCLTLTDNAGCVSTSCQIVYVYNWYCTTDFTVTGDTSNLLQYTFAVTNPSPTAMYYWDFGDGNIDTTSGATVTYTYAYAGVYYAYLTTYDLGTGCYNYNDAFVFAGSPNNCGVYYYNIPDHYNPLINTFYAYSYTGLPLSSCVWDFGDGNTSTSLSPTHTYSQNGYYYVCLTATDTSGCVATYCQHIYIYSTNNTSCSANFSATSDSSIAFTYNFAATTSITFPTYYWDFGDGSTIISNSNFISHTYQNSGTYYVCVNVYDNLTGCNVAYCGTIYVSATVNNCQADILYSNPQNLNTIDFSVFHTGAAPLNYHWDFGDGYTSTLPNPTHTYSTNGNILSVYYVTVIVSDINGCIAYGSTTVAIYPANNGSIISGVVAKDTSLQFVADAIVYLIQYDSINGTLTAVDTTQTVQGFYEFLNVPAGSYLVKAVLLPTDPNYANYLPTYYVQSLAWTAAQYITASPMSFAYSHDIVLVKGTNNGGAGFISGMVVNGAGRPIIGNQTVIEDIMTLEPMVDMSVLLLDESNGAITHTVTHTDGSYSFSNLGMGAYKVHVEECGKVTFPAEVTIDPNNMNHTNVHFTVHDNMVTLTMVYRAITNIETFNVFPNPVQENLTLELGLKEGMNFNLTVTNLIGQDIISENKQLEKGNHLFQMNLKDLPTGLYLLSLTSGTDVVTYKIFKQ